MKKYLILAILTVGALSGCSKMTPAELEAFEARMNNSPIKATAFQTTCIAGYTFTYNQYSVNDRPVQVLDREGHGIACE